MRDKKFLFALIAILACGLIAAGCGSDDSSTSADDITNQLEDVGVPQDQIDEAQEQLDNAPESIDEAVQQCLDNVDSSELSDDQKQNLKDVCESGGDAASGALENIPGN